MASATPTSSTDEVHTTSTFCRVCHASCPMEVDVVDNRVIAVRGDDIDAACGQLAAGQPVVLGARRR